MKKIKDEYLGYELIDGDKYKLYRISSAYYKGFKDERRSMGRYSNKIYKHN